MQVIGIQKCKINFQKTHSKKSSNKKNTEMLICWNLNTFFLSFYDFILQLISFSGALRLSSLEMMWLYSWIVAFLLSFFRGSSKLKTRIIFNRLNSINFLHVEFEKTRQLESLSILKIIIIFFFCCSAIQEYFTIQNTIQYSKAKDCASFYVSQLRLCYVV